MINVIFAAPGRIGSCPSRVMYVAWLFAKDNNSVSKKARIDIQPALSLSNEDKIRTIQPHDDDLVVMLRIDGYDVKRVMVNQGSGAEIMYLDLYKGLNLRPEDLTVYNSPLVSFNGKVVILIGRIRLPMQVGSEVVEVDFIVVDAYSLYMAIVARPWLHALGAVSSILHQKVKYPSRSCIKEIVGNQSIARQCLVVAILHQPETELSASTGGGL